MGTVLITGGCGFIGSHLIEKLIDSNSFKQIVVVDNMLMSSIKNFEDKILSQINIYSGDIANRDYLSIILQKHRIDTVIHLAVTPLVLSLTEPKFVFNNIVDMQLSILECQRYGLFEKLISFSTAEVYGEAGYNCLVNEQTGFKPRTTYAAAKAAADMLVFSYAATFNINYNILRLVNNFGPKKRVLQGAGIIPTAIRSIVENQKVVLYGRGEQIRNFLNVRDTVDVVMKIINNPVFVNEVFLLADPIPRKMIDVIKDIFYLMGMKENIVYKEMRVADVLSVSADILKAKEKLSFEPKVSWFDGLNECIDYYSNHKLF